MWRELTTFAAFPIGLALAALVAPVLRRVLGSLPGAAAVGSAAGLAVWLMSSVWVAALVVAAMAFAFALIGVGGNAGRWISRTGRSTAAPSALEGRGRGGPFGGGASGGW